MNTNLVSTHIFLYYESTGKYLLDNVAKFYKGPIFLSLVENNCSNDILLNYAKSLFDEIGLIYVENCGTDQYGFYHSFQHDDRKTDWIFYCHDKHPTKKNWLTEMIKIYEHVDESLLLEPKNGTISSLKHKQVQKSFETMLLNYASIDYRHRKDIVQSMHTLIWLHELERILLSKHSLGDKDFKYPTFSAGNTFLARRGIIEKSHSCIYEEFFNKGIYRTDGEVEHGLERFYFYVSNCMGYENIFI